MAHIPYHGEDWTIEEAARDAERARGAVRLRAGPADLVGLERGVEGPSPRAGGLAGPRGDGPGAPRAR